MFIVCDRRVKLATGRRTQTVNICTSAGVPGQYDYVIRFHSPSAVSEAYLEGLNPDSLDQFVSVLREMGGDIEQSPTHLLAQAALNHPNHDGHSPRSEWEAAARQATEAAIDLLVEEFIRDPYLHRVEHSIHCRLFELMSALPPLNERLRIAGWSTQPLHKEWPEYVARPEKENRRGNFDLAVLSPEATAAASLKAFRSGMIRPSIAIEIGLDYGQRHLAGDILKLRNSGIQDSYLIHLARPDAPSTPTQVEQLLHNCEFKSAYVHHLGDRTRVKRLNEAEIGEEAAGPRAT